MTAIEGRRELALSNLKKLFALESAPKMVFISGPADSGKSLLLRSLSEDFANSCLIDCLECVTMTVLYERILSQICAQQHLHQRPRRTNSSGTVAPKLCSTVTEFVTRLNASLDRKVLLLLDEVERLIQVDSNALSVLLRLPELNENISIVCCSREDFAAFGPTIGTGLQPICVTLSSFSHDEVAKLLVEELAAQVKSLPAKTISMYVQTVQQVASSTTKDLDIWRRLCWSLIQDSSGSTESIKPTRLPRIIQDTLDSQYRTEAFYRQSMDELNILQKYLLVAAYIASFQSAKEDVKAFGSEVVVKRKSKHTRTLFNPAKAKENCDIKLNVKLPKLFDQTRLIAIFYFLFQGLTCLPSIPQIQLAIRSLCERGFLRASPTNLRYRVNISKDFAHVIAASLEIDLKNMMNN